MQQYAVWFILLQNHSTFLKMLMYHYPLLSEVNKLTHNFVTLFQLILVFHNITCTGSRGYSF